VLGHVLEADAVVGVAQEVGSRVPRFHNATLPFDAQLDFPPARWGHPADHPGILPHETRPDPAWVSGSPPNPKAVWPRISGGNAAGGQFGNRNSGQFGLNVSYSTCLGG